MMIITNNPLSMDEAVDLVRGAIPTDEPTDPTPPEPVETAEEIEPDEVANDTELEAVETDDSAADAPEETAAEAEEVILPSNLRQNEDGDWQMRVVVDGEETFLRLDEITETVQKTQAADKRFQEASTKAKEIREAQQQINATREAYQQQLMAFEQELQAVRAASQLTPEQEAELAEHDPKALIQIQKLQQAREQKLAELAQQNAAANQQRLQYEAQRAMELLPEWQDPEVLKRERDGIVATATAAGFTHEEVNQIYDARYLPIFRKAWLYEQLQSGKEQAKAKRQAPKMVKKKAPVEREPMNVKRKKDAMARLEKTGKLDDALDALMAQRAS